MSPLLFIISLHFTKIRTMLKEFKLRESEIEETSSRLAKYKGPTIRVEIDDGPRRIKLTVPIGEIEQTKKRYKNRNLIILK